MSSLRTAFAASLALCALSAFAGTAAAAPERVPPGNSGAVQYTETLPGAGGEQTTKRLHEGEGGGKGHVLSAADKARLEAQGKEGKEAARLAAGGSPAARGGGGGAGAHGNGGGGESSGATPGAGQVIGTATGSSSSGGMGLLLPLLIAVAVVLAVAIVVVRRRPAG